MLEFLPISVSSFISLVFAVVTYLLWKKWSTSTQNLPPGPWWSMPILGHLLFLGNEPFKTFMKWKKHYGPIVSVQFGSFRTVVISDYKFIKEALNNPAFSGRPEIPMFQERSGGERHGILFSDGNEWTEQRRFILRHLKDFGFGKKSMEVIIQQEVSDVLEELSAEVGQPISLRERFGPAVLNSLWAFIAGERFKHDDPQLRHILDLFDTHLTEVNGLMALSLFMPWFAKNFRTLSGQEFMMKDLNTMLTFMKAPIENHKETHISGQNRDLIDAYIEEFQTCTDPNSSFLKEGEHLLQVICLDLFGAGAETTTTTLCWTLLYLATYPEIQDKLHSELDLVLGNSRRPCLDDKPNLPYLEAVTLEVLRFSSLAPMGLFHNTLTDATLGGYFIPKDTMIITNLYSCHFDEDYWGDPRVFRPERFLSEDVQSVIRHEAFLPFSCGKRVCLGEGLGRAELFLFVSSIFQKFKVMTVDGERPTLEPNVGTVLMPKPHKLILLERN